MQDNIDLSKVAVQRLGLEMIVVQSRERERNRKRCCYSRGGAGESSQHW